jgi:hypothetical protein
LKRAGSIALALLVSLGATGLAHGEARQEGNAIVHFKGGISPHALPRQGMAPVTVAIDSTFTAADGTDPPPQLQTISIEINRHGKIFDRGLPNCHIHAIQPATIAAARHICGDSIVGDGRVGVRVHLANQEPFTFRGPLLVFKAPRGEDGSRRLLAQVYGIHPPSAFVIAFKVEQKKSGDYGTAITTSLPEAARKWAYITHFEMKLHRVYTYRGRKHSYVSAGCGAPPGFPGALYPFARGTFGFAEGSRAVVSLTRDCAVSQTTR